MHLYEINAEIAMLLQQLEVDPETGEILASSDESSSSLTSWTWSAAAFWSIWPSNSWLPI